MDILKKIWESPVFVYLLNKGRLAVGNNKAFEVPKKGTISDAVFTYFSVSDQKLLETDFFGQALGIKLISDIQLNEKEKETTSNFEEFVNICKNLGYDEEDLSEQYYRIKSLREKLGI